MKFMRTPYPILAAVLLMAFKTEASGNDAQATPERTEFQEITIRFKGSRAWTATLLDVAAKGATGTGIADFDSLSSRYGLMGIYPKGVSSGIFGFRFRLRFPPDADGADIAGAYRNLPYITVDKWYTVVSKRKAGIGKKLNYGYLGGFVGGFAGVPFGILLLPFPEEHPDGTSGAHLYVGAFYGLWFGNILGSAVAVSKVDRHGHFFLTLAGSALLGAGVPYAIHVLSWKNGVVVSFPCGMVGPANWGNSGFGVRGKDFRTG